MSKPIESGSLRKNSLGLVAVTFMVISAAAPLTGVAGAVPIAFLMGSAQAAREIRSLILVSSERVQDGSRRVNDAGAAMQEIVDNVRRVTDIIGEITSASGEQSVCIGIGNESVGQLDQMTQQNAALVDGPGLQQEAHAGHFPGPQAMREARSLKPCSIAVPSRSDG